MARTRPWVQRQLGRLLGSRGMVPLRRPGLGAQTTTPHTTVRGVSRGFALENLTRKGISEPTRGALHRTADPAGRAGPGRRGPERSGRVTKGRYRLWAPSKGRRDRRQGGGDSRTGRRRVGTQRRTRARKKLQTPARARTGDRQALPDSLTHGVRTRGTPATPRKFPQSALTRLPGRGVGPRYFYRNTKERGGCGVCGWTPASARA